MTKLKLNKAALGVALAFASSAALAANTLGVYTPASVAAGTDTLVADNAYTAAYQFTGNQTHQVSYDAEIVYTTTGSGVLNSGFLQYNVANGAFLGTDTYYLVRQVGPDGSDVDAETTAVGTMFAQSTDGNGNYTSITFQINASANVGLGEALILTTVDPATEDDDNTFDISGLATIVANADLNASGDVTVSVEGQTSVPTDFDAADAAAATIIDMREGLELTANITSVTENVDLANGGVDFQAGAGVTLTSAATALQIGAVAGLDDGLDLTNAGDTVRVNVMGDNCAAVDDLAASVVFGEAGGSGANSTSRDYANCSWTYENDGTNATVVDFTDGNGDITITVDGTTKIDTANWDYMVSVDLHEDNEVNFFDLTDAADESHDWNASIEGGVAYIPYMFAFNGDTTNWSLVKVHNRSAGAVEVAARVTAKQCDIPCTSGAETRHTDYLLGSVAGNGIMQLTGDTILAALNTPTGMATDGYNEAAAGLDLTKLFHLSVELVFVNTDADMMDVEVQNSASAGRSTANVSYENSGTYARDNKSN